MHLVKFCDFKVKFADFLSISYKYVTSFWRDITWFSLQWHWIFFIPHTAWKTSVELIKSSLTINCTKNPLWEDMEWQDQIELSDCVPRMQCKNSESFGEEIVLLYLLFFLLNSTTVRIQCARNHESYLHWKIPVRNVQQWNEAHLSGPSKMGWDCYVSLLTGSSAQYCIWRYPEVSPLAGCFVNTYQQIITISVNDRRKSLLNSILFTTYSHSFLFSVLQFWSHNKYIFIIKSICKDAKRSSKGNVQGTSFRLNNKIK